MRTILHTKLGIALAAAGLLAFAAPQLQAGPGPRLYAPVRTEKEANALKPGESIAVSCGNCGGITVMTVDKDRSILHSFECPGCKREFRVKLVGESGKMHAVGEYILVDKKGKTAMVAVAH